MTSTPLLARRMLEKAGCAASLCGNGREAVEADAPGDRRQRAAL